MSTSIHDLPPRETAGRDMILRVNMQHQAAAFAALEVLEGKEVDRVYCDYHDDFVVRRQRGGSVSYHFFQVKTKKKQNHQWSVSEVFAIKRRQTADPASLKEIEDSFAGRLITLSIRFGESCRQVTLLTNVQFEDSVESLVGELHMGAPAAKPTKFLVENFCAIFHVALDDGAARAVLKRLSLLPGVTYIGDERAQFAVSARAAIYRYSEIDLEHHEAAEIAADLVTLVNRKSIADIGGVEPAALDDIVGVGLTDLLAVLSISPQAYRALQAGEDPKALKTASFIQRKLKAAGANEQMIEFASQKKVAWDIWMREARHTYREYDLNFLLQTTDDIRGAWMTKGGAIQELKPLLASAIGSGLTLTFPTLTEELLLGGVIAAFVRRGTA